MHLHRGTGESEMIDLSLKKTAVEGWVFLSRVRTALMRNHRYGGFAAIKKRFYHRMWQQAAEAVGAALEDIGSGFCRIQRGGRVTFVRGSDVMLDNHLLLKMAGNKPLMQKLLAERGYPVLPCRVFELADIDPALQFLAETGGPCVVKPAEGGAAGKGITTGIESEADLRKAAYWAAQFERRLLIEKQVPGHSYRLLYLRGEFIDAIRRDPPEVTGDGRSTVRTLIERENRARLSAAEDTLSLHPIVPDPDLSLTLRRQRLSLKSVPAAGQRVVVKTVVNQNSRLQNHTVRDEVHPHIMALGRELTRWLNIELAGIDIMTTDIAKPLAETGGIINEINTTPGLHHHYLISDPRKSVPVAEIILKHIFEVQ